MGNYDAKTIIDLDECVINALNLFIDEGLSKLHLGNFKRPLVLGSGNAAATGRILFEGVDAVEADDAAAVAELAEQGFDQKFGARPLRRTIQTKVDDALANHLLKGEIGRRDKVILETGNEIRIEKAEEI